MPLLFIRARNSEFASCDDGAEYDQPEVALALGVQSAIAIIADEVNRGERSAAVEISIASEDGTQVLSSVVALSVSPLIATLRPFRPAIA